jgi:hypothetical protein
MGESTRGAMMRFKQSIQVLVFLAVPCLWVGSALAQNAVTSETNVRTSRLNAVNALLVALKRQNDENSAGKDREIEGIESGLRDANQLLAGGNDGEAGKLIDRLYVQTKSAIASMQKTTTLKSGSAAVEASRQDAPSEAELSVLKTTFSNREASVSALLAAGNRVASEKGQHRVELQEAEQQLTKARTLAKQGSLKAAIVLLDQPYQTAKKVVLGLRNGEQLTADKNFATLADEFKYEQSRNDDYQHLIATLPHHSDDEAWMAVAHKGKTLRADSEQSARSNQWTNALEQIGHSTQELKSLLKLAGFPIM